METFYLTQTILRRHILFWFVGKFTSFSILADAKVERIFLTMKYHGKQSEVIFLHSYQYKRILLEGLMIKLETFYLTQTILRRHNSLLICWQVNSVQHFSRLERWANFLNHKILWETFRSSFSAMISSSENSVGRFNN